MSQHCGIIVAVDESDHIAFICNKFQQPMKVVGIHTSEPDPACGLEKVSRIMLKCTGCGFEHWRKFDWMGKTAEICTHRTDNGKLIDRRGEARES